MKTMEFPDDAVVIWIDDKCTIHMTRGQIGDRDKPKSEDDKVERHTLMGGMLLVIGTQLQDDPEYFDEMFETIFKQHMRPSSS